MASNTSKLLRKQVMYQIFVRNFSQEGTFGAVLEKLPRIREMGVDVIWLMPIHPIGKVQRKGTLGSPYAISDYRSINPEFGSLEDLRSLVGEIHSLGMKCIIDVVFNHTSPDSVLSREHPEWFYHKADGSFGNRVGEWTDIIDLDYRHQELWRYQIDTLKYWAEIVDGFRCDVAPLIPIEFWEQARAEVEEVRPGCIWLSESIDPGFITYLRGQGMIAQSDSEMYRAFDLCYDYDCYGDMTAFLDGRGSLESYAQAVSRQEYIFPENYVKLRFLENHDQPRAAFLIPEERSLRNWTAFTYFQRGMTLIYAGQENRAAHLPDLFDKDVVHFEESRSLYRLMQRLAQIKQELPKEGSYRVKADRESFLVAEYTHSEAKTVGIFAVKGDTGLVRVELPDGIYREQISRTEVEVFRGCIAVKGEPIIIGTGDRKL